MHCITQDLLKLREQLSAYVLLIQNVMPLSMLHSGLISRHPQTPEIDALHYTGPLETPAAAVNLRAIDPERYAIVNEEDSEVIEEIEESKAFYEVYDGAVYMFQVRTESLCCCAALPDVYLLTAMSVK